MPANASTNHRSPAEIIRHVVWLYFRFCLSDRDMEELRFARGVPVTSEAIRGVEHSKRKSPDGTS